MARYFAPLTILLMLGMVLTRAVLMKKNGIEAMNFGKLDKTDFSIVSTTDSDESSSLRSIESDRLKVPCNYMELNKSL
jgi:hypothetical protein